MQQIIRGLFQEEEGNMSLIGKDVRLKNSPNTVEISKADNRGIYLDFGSGKPIYDRKKKCESLLILDETLKAELLEAFK